jgi:8-oxo-dGTP pyrophosphatase MutT (NUDIX family)
MRDLLLDPETFRQLASARLLSAPLAADEDPTPFGDHVIAGVPFEPALAAAARPAAVLVPIIKKRGGLSLLLTERASGLSSHAGQVAFPGGRIESGESARDAALREAAEEISLPLSDVETLGYLEPYFSGSGYRVQPVVAFIEDGLPLQPQPGEVARIFDVPLGLVLDRDQYSRGQIIWRGRERSFYILNHPGAYIWGVTAGILRAFAEKF